MNLLNALAGQRPLLVAACFAVSLAMSPLLLADPPPQYEAQKLLASSGAAGARFGTSVAVSGDTAVVGAEYAIRDGQFTGAAYVFARDASGAWIEEAELVASDSIGQPNFGNAVAVDGDTVVIGAPFDGYRARGSAYVYQRNPGGSWSEQAKLLPSDSAYNFGRAVSISGDTVLIGVQDDENGFAAGAAYVFTRDAGGNWFEHSKLIASDGMALDFFGASVALEGELAVIGAERNDDDGQSTGSVYVFIRDRNGDWSEETKLRGRDSYPMSLFGHSVAMSEGTVLVAAGGSVYVFTRDAGGVWSEQALLVAEDGRTGAFSDFVSSVAISGDTASIQRGGSRYLYTRNESGVWSARVELRARPDAAPGFIGRATAISGDTALVGSYAHADGLGGAVYVFDLENLEPRVFLHCSRDLSADHTVAIAVVAGAHVTVKALDGTVLSDFSLGDLEDVIDTELMADTNGNGTPELVALDRSSGTAVVRDLSSGEDLGIVHFPTDLAPIDLELADDRTGNGIAELAGLGRDPARVQIRDGLMSDFLVDEARFSGYVIGKDLTLYADLDGSGALALAVLAENRRPEDADKIEIRNASSGDRIREIWLGKGWQGLEQQRIGDLDGNGSEEIAVLQREPDFPGSVRVQIRDLETSAWINFVGFANRYLPQALVVIPDIDGNGADELVVFGRHRRGFNQKAVIKDARTGEKLSELRFDRAFPGRDFVSCGDIDGNGAADLAMLGQRPEDGQLQVIVKDSRTGERLGFVWF